MRFLLSTLLLGGVLRFFRRAVLRLLLVGVLSFAVLLWIGVLGVAHLVAVVRHALGC